MKEKQMIRTASHLADVKYEIRGPLDKRAMELERQGAEIIRLNIGNPAAFGFTAPGELRRAITENIGYCSGYGPSKGLFSAREAVLSDAQGKDIPNLSIDDIFMGNGVSELIMICMEALLENGDEVLIPAPDYPLWTASVVINRGRPLYYQCKPENNFLPDPTEIERSITSKTRAIVIINPNNPTGAVYPRELLAEIVRIAEKHSLILFSDEIYDKILFDNAQHLPTASLCEGTLCVTFGGLSKVYRAAGYRTGWAVFSGNKHGSGHYLRALDLLASLRLSPNVLGQWAVPSAINGRQSIFELTADTGRLGIQRRALIEAVQRSCFLSLVKPRGAMYGFIKVKNESIPQFDDQLFAMELLEQKNVLVVPGSSFNVSYKDHFRVTILPDASTLGVVFNRVENLLAEWAKRQGDNKSSAA